MQTSLKPVNCLKIPIFFLKFFGIWHFDNRFQSFYYVYGKIIYILVCVYYVSGQLINLFMVWGNLPEMADGISLIITIICLTFKIGALNLKQLKETIQIQNSKHFTSHKIDQDFYLINYMNIAKRNGILILAICTITCFSTGMEPILTRATKNKKLPIHAWYPIPYTKSPYYEMIYFYEWSGLLIGAWLHCSLDALMAGLMALTCGQLQVLKHSLRNLRCRAMARLEQYHEANVCKMCDDNEQMAWKCADPVHLAKNNYILDRAIYEEMKNCIKHHCAIIEFIDEFDKTFTSSMLAQFSASMLVICITAFVLSVVTPFTTQFIAYMMYLVNMIMQIFFYCWYGNEVYLTSSTINDAIYNSDWYTFSPKVKKLMMTMMERSKKPIILTAGKLFELSLETFTSILRSAYSFYAVLQQLDVNINLDITD